MKMMMMMKILTFFFVFVYKQMAIRESPIIEILDNMCFQEFSDDIFSAKSRRLKDRWLLNSPLNKAIEG